MEVSSTASDLPFIDEHSVVIAASSHDVWDALVDLERSFAGPGVAILVRALGCADPTASGPRPLAEGSSMPGFHVVSAEPPTQLALAGRHRFSTYALTFHIEQLDEDSSRLVAETRAAFPGLTGSLYRALVIGTRGHVLAVRRLLSGIRRSAERRARA